MDDSERFKLVRWLNQNKTNQQAKKLLQSKFKKPREGLDMGIPHVVQLMNWGLDEAGLELEVEMPVSALIRSMWNADPTLVMNYLLKTPEGDDLPLELSPKDTAKRLAAELLERVRDRLDDHMPGRGDNLSLYKFR